MLKDLDKGNWIIPPWDPRYGKLGHIWKKWNYENIILGSGVGSVRYYIIPDLVINEYTGRVRMPILKSHDAENAISQYRIKDVIMITCNITFQEYFDLIALKINNKSDRPKCHNCNSALPFSDRWSKGYGNGGGYWIDKNQIYCSRSCAAYYAGTHPDEYPNMAEHIKTWYTEGWKSAHILGPEAMKSTRSRAKNAMIKFINLGNPSDLCHLYIAHNGIDIKYGASKDIMIRQSYGLNLYGSVYKYIHKIYSSDRTSIAYLEASLRLQFDTETLPFSKLSGLLSTIKGIISEGIHNPFEQD